MHNYKLLAWTRGLQSRFNLIEIKKACMSWTSFFQSFILLPVHFLIKSNTTKAWHKRCDFCVSHETKWLSHLPFATSWKSMKIIHWSPVRDFTNPEQSSTKKPNLFCIGTKTAIYSIINLILEDSADSSGKYFVYVSQRRRKGTPDDRIQTP